MSSFNNPFTAVALANLDAQIAAMVGENQYQNKTYAGRGEAWLSTIKAAMTIPQFRESVAPMGPWIMINCPNGHKIGPVRFELDPEHEITNIPTGNLYAGKKTLTHLVNDELIGSQNSFTINDRRRWNGCDLKACDWPGNSYRPEQILKMYVLALKLNLRHVPIQLVRVKDISAR